MTVTRAADSQIGEVARPLKTGELIAAQLRRQIVRGVLKPGQTLPPETQLMEHFGVSRPTLREAFRILEAETLISVRRGSRGGAKVIVVATHMEQRVSGHFDAEESPQRFRKAIRAYKRLLTLVEARDAAGAEKLWRAHMEAAAAYLLKDDLRDKPVVELFG